MELARQQAQLNRLVIEEMADGVLVVDRDLRVRATNPAARSLLSAKGLGPAAPFQLQGRAEWATLSQAVQRALAEAYWPEAGGDVVLNFAPGDTRTLAHARALHAAAARCSRARLRPRSSACCCSKTCAPRRRRLRQEKLAAMGRVSAGIAHEIRNPLSAIAQANALLLEDALPEAQQRLLRMVADNVARLKRLVDEVMEVAPGTAPMPSSHRRHRRGGGGGRRMGAHRRHATRAQAAGCGWTCRRRRCAWSSTPSTCAACWSTCSTTPSAMAATRRAPSACAWRRATKAARCCWSTATAPPIAQEVERYLFEPFFSTRSRGTGLGLYICRELCERYGASIEYRLRPDGQRNLFLVIMRRETALSAEAKAPTTA